MHDLRRMLHALDLLSSAWRRKHGISANEQLALVLLATTGPHTPKDLSDFVGVTTGGMSTLLDRLEARGYVKRTAKEGDRRRVLITLTKSGLQANLDREKAHAQLAEKLEQRADGECEALTRFFVEGEEIIIECAEQMTGRPIERYLPPR